MGKFVLVKEKSGPGPWQFNDKTPCICVPKGTIIRTTYVIKYNHINFLKCYIPSACWTLEILNCTPEHKLCGDVQFQNDKTNCEIPFEFDLDLCKFPCEDKCDFTVIFRFKEKNCSDVYEDRFCIIFVVKLCNISIEYNQAIFERTTPLCIDTGNSTSTPIDSGFSYEINIFKGTPICELVNRPYFKLVIGDCDKALCDLESLIGDLEAFKVSYLEFMIEDISINSNQIIFLCDIPKADYPLTITINTNLIYLGVDNIFSTNDEYNLLCCDSIIIDKLVKDMPSYIFGLFEITDCKGIFKAIDTNTDVLGKAISEKFVESFNNASPGSYVFATSDEIPDTIKLLYTWNTVPEEECCGIITVIHRISVVPDNLGCDFELTLEDELELEPCETPLIPRKIVILDCKIDFEIKCRFNLPIYILKGNFTLQLINPNAVPINSPAFNVIIQSPGKSDIIIPIAAVVLGPNEIKESMRMFTMLAFPGNLLITITTDDPNNTTECVINTELPNFPEDTCEPTCPPKFNPRCKHTCKSSKKCSKNKHGCHSKSIKKV